MGDEFERMMDVRLPVVDCPKCGLALVLRSSFVGMELRHEYVLARDCKCRGPLVLADRALDELVFIPANVVCEVPKSRSASDAG